MNYSNFFRKFIVNFSIIIFVLCLFSSIIFFSYTIFKIFNPPEIVTQTFYLVCLFISFILIIFFGSGLLIFSSNSKINLSIVFCSIGITLYSLEIYFIVSGDNQLTRNNLDTEKKIHYPMDRRSQGEIINDFKNSGKFVLPNVGPYFFVETNGLEYKNKKIFPLGSISNTYQTFNNETGYYPIIKTDKYGFNNKEPLYEEGKVDILLTGDSFTEGNTVLSGQNISSILKNFGFNCINIAKAGNGPLIQYASLKEYGKILKPKIFLWVYYVNDIDDLNKEINSSLLMRYINEDNYHQDLISRQKEIDETLNEYIKKIWLKNENSMNQKKDEKELDQKNNKIKKNLHNGIFEKKEKKRKINLNIKQFVKLTELRRILNLRPSSINPLFKEILIKSKKMTATWDGQMYFIYLPSYSRYSGNKKDINHNSVMRIVTKLKIPIIDVHEEVFKKHKDPKSLFPLRKNNHYNAEGYRLIGEAIIKRLKRDRLIN